MKIISFFISFFLAAICSAQTLNVQPRQVYVGTEAVNEHLTGRKCYITIQDVQPVSDKGLYCYSIDFLFASLNAEVPKGTLSVVSRVTNYDRPEFPKIRTCAMNVNGTTSGDEIYGQDTALLYNQIFGGSHKDGMTQYDYFLTLSPTTKEAVLARVHVMHLFSETDIDCVNLEKM